MLPASLGFPEMGWNGACMDGEWGIQIVPECYILWVATSLVLRNALRVCIVQQQPRTSTRQIQSRVNVLLTSRISRVDVLCCCCRLLLCRALLRTNEVATHKI